MLPVLISWLVELITLYCFPIIGYVWKYVLYTNLHTYIKMWLYLAGNEFALATFGLIVGDGAWNLKQDKHFIKERG